MTLAAAPCASHPGREALGVCVHCRRLVCSECSTRIEGVNHCASCLAARVTTDAAPTGRRGLRDGVVLAVAGVAMLVGLRLVLELVFGRV